MKSIEPIYIPQSNSFGPISYLFSFIGVLSEFHEIFVKRPNGYPKMMPTISQIKVIGGIGIEKRSIIGIASITAPITSGIVSLASSFL